MESDISYSQRETRALAWFFMRRIQVGLERVLEVALEGRVA